MLFSSVVLFTFVSCILDLHSGRTFLSLSHFMPLQFNWYTRRAVLTGIYNTTELVMMQDSSPDFEDTWRFLENRVADAMNMGNTANQVTLQARYTCSVPLLPKYICRQTWLFSHAGHTSAERLPCIVRWLHKCCQFNVNKHLFSSEMIRRRTLCQTGPMVRRHIFPGNLFHASYLWLSFVCSAWLLSAPFCSK